MKLKFKITFIILLFSLLTMIFASLFYANHLYESRLKLSRIEMINKSSDLAFHIEINLFDKLNLVKTMINANLVEEALLNSNFNYKDLSKKEISRKISELNKKWMSIDDENDTFIKRYTNNKLSLYLKKEKNTFPNLFGEIFITNKYGAMIAATGKLTTLEHEQKYWWKQCYGGGKSQIFFDDRGFDDSVNGYVLGIVVPIKKNGKFIGIIKANINIQSLFDTVTKKSTQENVGAIKIVRSGGLIVYEKNLPPLSTRVPLKLSKKLKTLKTGVVDMKILDEDKIVAYSPVKISLKYDNIIFGGTKSSIDHILGNDGELWHVVIEEDKAKIFNDAIDDTKDVANIVLGFVLLIIVLLFMIIGKLSAPLLRLSFAAKRIGEGEKNIKIEPESDDEVGELAVSLRDMLENLKKTTASRDELELEIKKRIQMQEELKKQDEILIAQSKQAAMGEMIGMIAHQWRQPISIIAMIVNNIQIDMELGELKEEDIKKCSQEIISETMYLSQTIDDFRNFFKPDKEKELIEVQELFENVLKIIGKSFESNKIELIFSKDLDVKINTYANELTQVFLNILNNAKDALEESCVKDKKVSVSAYMEEGFITFKFCDNGENIKEELKDKIFEPYFSTKKEKNGTGIGLYMCKMIVEKHMLGKIWTENNKDGVCFMVKLPIEQIGAEYE